VFAIYKKEQGKWTRGLTMGGIAAAALWGANWLWNSPLVAIGLSLRLNNEWMTVLKVIGSAAFIVVGLYLGFWISYLKSGTGDFFIATEGEMKKVSWSSTREVIASTWVVVFTLLLMGVLLFAVDVVFIMIFSWINVLQIAPLKALFGGGA
jgi:preprotein translocase SecE subunit